MHYVRMSATVMAMQSCHCDAQQNHLAGEEFYKASPAPFYASLGRHMFDEGLGFTKEQNEILDAYAKHHFGIERPGGTNEAKTNERINS